MRSYLLIIYYSFFILHFFFAVFFAAAFFAGLDLPKEPLNLLPFAVFLSPRPIVPVFKK